MEQNASSPGGLVHAPFRGTRFDWLDASTYGILFKVDATIDRIYLIAPRILDMLPPMKAFIDFAIDKGVKRFVLMSAGLIEAGGPGMGLVHEYLASLNVEYCVLRPSYFFGAPSARFVSSRDVSLSAAEDCRIPMISTEEIAQQAFKALMHPVPENTQPILVGPELLSYDRIAAMPSQVLGREIKHERLHADDYTQVLVQRGMPEDYAQMMSGADVFKRADFVGKKRLREFLEANKLNAQQWRAKSG
ncbi:hypothetical protein B0H11DRAFT_2162971 [Mycena galericulata]|nr:hypothetical protein B0H11DRAFT_2162971 [Mycena galericulata]